MHPGTVIPDSPIEAAVCVPPSRWRRVRRRTYELLERAEHGDRASLYVDAALILLISLSVLAVILESVVSIYAQFELEFFRFEVFTIAVFTIEYLLRIWSSVEAPEYAQEASAQRFPRLRYIASPSAIIDFLAIMPFYLVTAGLVGNGDMRFVRALRLLRILKLTRYSAAFDSLLKAFTDNARSFVAAFTLLIIVMLLAATGMYFFEKDAQPEAFSSIPAAMWWAFATLTTVGYGDITPVTVGGRVFGAMITVVGVGMVALPTGILASAYTEQLRLRTDEYRRQSKDAWEDGILTATEMQDLEQLRESLGLGRNTASQILNSEKVRAALKEEHAHACPHCGNPAD